MNKLEPIHEQAIDLFVAGKRQCEIAKELNVNPRTLRRWSDSELFVKELRRQHEQARKLELDARAEFNRRRQEFQEFVMNQIESLLKDTTTPPQLRAACLKLGMQDMNATARQADAQAWRAYVYADKKAERKAEEEKDAEERVKIMNASHRIGQSTSLLDHLFARARDEKADKSGHTPSGPGVPPGPKSDGHSSTKGASVSREAAKSGHLTPPPVVKPVQPFRYPRPEKKDANAVPQASALQEK